MLSAWVYAGCVGGSTRKAIALRPADASRWAWHSVAMEESKLWSATIQELVMPHKLLMSSLGLNTPLCCKSTQASGRAYHGHHTLVILSLGPCYKGYMLSRTRPAPAGCLNVDAACRVALLLLSEQQQHTHTPQTPHTRGQVATESSKQGAQ